MHMGLARWNAMFYKNTCQVTSGERYPYQEIYFKKNTNIPLRSTEIHRTHWKMIQETTNFIIKSKGKPNPQIIYPNVDESIDVQVRLFTPPHRIHGMLLNVTIVSHGYQKNFLFRFLMEEVLI